MVLLAILSSGKDNEMLRRNWPYLKVPGWDLVGFGTKDKACVWPENIERFDTGEVGTRKTPAGQSIYGLVRSELEIWKLFLERPQYDSVCVVESDNIFVRMPPEHPGGGLYLVTLLPNYARAGLFKTPMYFSTPRWADRKCAEQLYYHGTEMFRCGDTEWDMSDRFPAHICQSHRIPWIAQPAWSPPAFACGGTYEEVWGRDARAAIKMGAYALHSVKYDWQINVVKEALAECQS